MTQTHPYSKDIKRVILDLQSKSQPISLLNILNQLTLQIQESITSKTTQNSLKNNWSRVIKSTVKDMGVSLATSKVNDSFWVEFVEPSTAPPSTASCPHSAIISSKSSKTSKSGELTDDDKIEIEAMFENLDKDKMWVLETSNRKVEEVMKGFALGCRFEHPVHSLILDVTDKSWMGIFSVDEIKEIKQWGKKALPEAPEDVNHFLQDILSCADAHDAYMKAGAILSNPKLKPLLSWAEFAVMEASRLFFSEDVITLDTESDLKSCYSMLLSVFRGSLIKATNGEKASNSSANSKNKKRLINGLAKMERAKIGSKVDLLYSYAGYELGCIEMGLTNSTANTTKELEDGYFKLSKTMKDIFYNICLKNPSIVHDITVSGFLAMGFNSQLVQMDCPKGYVARITRSKMIPFPTATKFFGKHIVPMLKMALLGRLSMERTIVAISNDHSEKSFSLDDDDDEKEVLTSCFH